MYEFSDLMLSFYVIKFYIIGTIFHWNIMSIMKVAWTIDVFIY